MFQAFVLICLIGMPTENRYCVELADTRGPYMLHDKCLARVYEIKEELHLYKPNMQARAYRCDEFTPQTEKQST